MEPIQQPEDTSKDNGPTIPADSNTDIAVEDALPSKSPKINPEKPSEPEEANSRRRDSVLAEDVRQSKSSNGHDTRDPAADEGLVLEDSFLKTLSHPTNSKATPTPSSRPTPNLGQSILKTPPATGKSKTSDTQPLKTSDSIWTFKYDGKAWPLILCEEESTPEVFLKSRQGNSHLPAILLGKRI